MQGKFSVTYGSLQSLHIRSVVIGQQDMDVTEDPARIVVAVNQFAFPDDMGKAICYDIQESFAHTVSSLFFRSQAVFAVFYVFFVAAYAFKGLRKYFSAFADPANSFGGVPTMSA